MSMIPSSKSTKRIAYDLIPGTETGATVDFPARITRFVGLGVQNQPPYKGQVKQPAFKAAFTFELIGVDTSGVVIENEGTDSETREQLDARPACQFQDYFLFPGASRGNVFNLCQAVDPALTEVPGDLSWFIDNLLDKVISVRVGSYVVQKGDNAGQRKNCVKGVTAIPSMFASQVGAARTDLVGFDPYTDSPAMFASFSNMYKFQRDILLEAHDSKNIIFAGKEPMKPEDADKQVAPTKEATKAPVATDSQDAASGVDDDTPF